MKERRHTEGAQEGRQHLADSAHACFAQDPTCKALDLRRDHLLDSIDEPEEPIILAKITLLR